MSLVIDAVRDFGAGLMSVRAAAAPYEEYSQKKADKHREDGGTTGKKKKEDNR